MRIFAFTGTRYTESDQAGPWAGPPYDQIDPELQRQLHEQPYHFAHLIRPSGPVDHAHQAVADLHQNWLESQVLCREAAPSLYPYEIRTPDGELRLGISALVGLEDPDSQIIRPHEATVDKTIAERLSLLRHTQIDLEPILMLAKDDGAINRLLAEDLQDSLPQVRHRDAEGNTHILYRIEDPDRIQTYRDTLSRCVGLIADGHHRYTVASQYAQEVEAEPGTVAASKLAVITSLASPGLQIDPIHRRLEQAPPVTEASALASNRREIPAVSGRDIADSVAAAPQPALGVSVGNHTEIWSFAAAEAPDSVAEHLRHLSVGWLHESVLPTLGLPPAAATNGTVQYRSDPERLYAELQDGSAAVGFWLPPMSGEDFARAMSGGSLLPPKSTRFLPKVASGLVWVSHDTSLS